MVGVGAVWNTRFGGGVPEAAGIEDVAVVERIRGGAGFGANAVLASAEEPVASVVDASIVCGVEGAARNTCELCGFEEVDVGLSLHRGGLGGLSIDGQTSELGEVNDIRVEEIEVDVVPGSRFCPVAV